MLRKNAKVQLLRRVPLFSDCSKKELEQVARVTDELSFAAGRTLMKEGRPGRECFIVIDGEVAVTRKGRRVPLRGSSELFGEMALLTDRPRNATVTAVTPVRALVVSSRGFRSVLQATPPIAIKILASLAERIQAEA